MTATWDQEEYVQWGVVTGDGLFIEKDSEADARQWVEWSRPGARKLARRTIGPVELVQD